MEADETCGHGEMIVYKTIVGKPQGAIRTGRPRLGWEDNML
jgi:hypothetical protein